MDSQKIVNYRNTRNLFGRRLGIVIEEVGPQCARAVKTVEADDVNPMGTAHGAVYFAIVDAACAAAVSTYGYAAVTVRADFNFLKSARVGNLLIAEATEINREGKICVYETRVMGPDGTLYGSGAFTFFQLTDKRLDL